MAKLFTTILLLLICAASVFAGTTGKIAGKVTDAETGEPLVGANVILLNTQLGASVDVDGDFYVLNIPPGTYTVEVSMIGYATTQLTDVKVFLDRTTPVNAQLGESVLETEEITVVAPRVAVKRDVSQSEISATADQIEDTPIVTGIMDYMNLQAGIQLVEGEDDEVQEMQIRGGGMDQVGMVVDGLTMTNNIDGGPIDVVNLSAIQEVSIIKGGFNAEYGNIRSGLFNVVTKEPDREYHVSLDMRYTPAQQKHRGAGLFDPDNHWVRPYVDPAVAWVGTKNGDWDTYTQGQFPEFEGWNSFAARVNNDDNPANDITAEEARNLFIWQHRMDGSKALGHPHPGKYGDNPDLFMDASFGGPVPFISEDLGNLRFFASYSYDEEQYVFPQQIDAIKNTNWMVKLNSDISKSMKLGVEAIVGLEELVDSEASQAGGGGGGVDDRGAYFRFGSSPMDVNTNVFGLTFDHVLSPSTFYKVRLSFVNVENDANRWFNSTIRDTTTIRTFGSYQMDEQPYGFLLEPGYNNAIAGIMITGGVGGAYRNQNKVNTINFKADLTSQVNKYNQLQAGLEFIYDDFDIYEEVADLADDTGDELIEWSESPYRIQGYIQDKLEYEEFVANFGVRVDYTDPNSKSYFVDPYSHFFSRQYKAQLLDEGESKAAKTNLTFSPRIGVAHPITETSKLYFNYGHFYDQPNSYDRFQINYGKGSSAISVVGNAGLKPRKSIAYELGYEHDIEDLFLLRLIGYYKDVSNEIGEVNYVNYDESVNYSTFQNDHYADIRGFEVELRRDWGAWVTGWINYTLMVQSDGLVGREFQYQDLRKQAVEGKRNPNVEKPLPRPFANANLRIMTPQDWGPEVMGNHIFDRFSFNFLGSWRTGDYLTWEPGIQNPTEENNLQWKDIWNLDLRISKFFTIDQYEFNFFVDIFNVFDFKYLTGAGFREGEEGSDWRDYLNSLHLPEYKENKYKNDNRLTGGNDQVGDVRTKDKPYINMPNLDYLAWNRPRSIVLGFRIGF
jgi:hypothetical protein